MISALTHLQHARGKNVVFVAILDERLDDYNRKVFVPQIEGSKTSLELPGIVDEVVTLAEIKADPQFAEMVLVRNSRLSVQPVTDEEWEIVLELAREAAEG